MKELKIKTFMTDSRRPAWLLSLLFHVNAYFPFNSLNEMPSDNAISWIEDCLDEITYVRRNSREKLVNFIRYEIDGAKLTIFTLYKNNPMVEFEIVEKEGGQP